MKYSRIVLFSLGLYLLLVVLSTIATLLVGAEEATQSMPFIFTQHILGFVISLIAYFYLGYKQSTSPYKQAVLVAAVYWFIELSMSVLLYIFFDIPIEPVIFLIPVLLHAIAVLLGTLLGIQLRHKRELGVSAI